MVEVKLIGNDVYISLSEIAIKTLERVGSSLETRLSSLTRDKLKVLIKKEDFKNGENGVKVKKINGVLSIEINDGAYQKIRDSPLYTANCKEIDGIDSIILAKESIYRISSGK